jgi:mRNA interferase YafQ
MYGFKVTTRYLKDFKNLQNNIELTEELLFLLKLIQQNENLPEKDKDHSLKGKLTGYRECHIKPDILLIYKKK